MHIYSSNRLETLANTFASLYTQKSKNAFIERPVVVQNQGMARWLQLFLADKSNISLNFEHLYPRANIMNLVSRVLNIDEKDFFPDSSKLVWPIYHLLPQMTSGSNFEAIKHYLSDKDPFKRLQLSFKIASLFDEYVLYRPELVLKWENADFGNNWQGELWYELWQKLGKPKHLASLESQLTRCPVDPNFLPESIHLFGLTTLPPLYVRFMKTYSEYVPFHFYLLQPSPDFWSELDSEKTKAKALVQTENLNPDLYEIGNPLLGSFSKQGRDLINLLIDNHANPTSDEYVDPVPSNCLSLLQHDIFNLINRSEADADKFEFQKEDSSVLIHNCHGPMRELECLHDYLLNCFKELDDLEAKEVLVLCPDLEKYAPYINAVFGSTESDRLYIPYSLSDRKVRNEQDEVDTFLRILELANSRVSSRDISELLHTQTFCNKFQFNQAELDRIKDWIADVGIRWGIDKKHVSQFGMESYDQNTWRHGLNSLLAGFAMRSHGENLYNGLLAYDEIEGQQCELLGRFVEAVEFLLSFTEELKKERTRKDWSDFLISQLDELVDGHAENLKIIQGIQDSIELLSDPDDGADEMVPASTIHYYLSQILEESQESTGFLQGKVSFAELKPLRSIPARVICLLGMDFGAFPRIGNHVEFDLIQKERQLGDRSAREGDRYLFLESILSARERILFSYSGQSLKDNSDSPMSVVLSELYDYLEESIQWPKSLSAEQSLVRKHKIHGSDKSYFENKDFYTYSKAKEASANTVKSSENKELCKLNIHLSEPEDSFKEINLQQLIRFYRNPCKWFLQECVKLKLAEEGESLDETELFKANGLSNYLLKQNLSEDIIHKKDASYTKEIQRIHGNLPLGQVSESVFEQGSKSVELFYEKLQPYVDVAPSPDLHEELKIGGYKLGLEFKGLRGNYLPLFRCSSIKAKDMIPAWLTHLAIHACGAIEDKPEVVLIGEDKIIRFEQVDDPKAILADLLSLYWKGQQEVIPFFTGASYEYVEKIRAGKDGVSGATKKWKSDYNYTGESEDPFYEFYYNHVCPMEDPGIVEQFKIASMTVYKPLLEALNEES